MQQKYRDISLLRLIYLMNKNNILTNKLRDDRWWISPLLVLLGLLSFIIYSTWAAWQGEYFWWSAGKEGFGGYLSPFYSPTVFIDSTKLGIPPIDHALLGLWPKWLSWLPGQSPAWLILIFPLSFRFTCYYYRKAYYRAFAWSPPACSIQPVKGIPSKITGKQYKGETGLLIFQNIHRYAMYFAIIFIFILSYDAYISFFNNGNFGVGVGSIILLINPILLGCYVFGCHSLRHLVGGNFDCYSCSLYRDQVSHNSWKIVTILNRRHELFAWLSLIWVGFADVYVRLVSMGIINDLNTWKL